MLNFKPSGILKDHGGVLLLQMAALEGRGRLIEGNCRRYSHNERDSFSTQIEYQEPFAWWDLTADQV
jgi:hypothetical protein